jgi:hypothetical protein
VLCTKFPDAANTTVQRILEKAGSVEPAFAERYLQAIDTELARQILDYYGREWVNFDPPLDRASSQVGFFCQTVRVSAAHRGIRLTWTWPDRSASH